MRKFYLGGVAAALGLAAMAQAQPAAPVSAKQFRPAFVPAKTTGVITQVKSDAPLAPPIMSVIPPAAVVPSPVVSHPVAEGCAPAISSDVAAACGDSCGPAMDCLCGPPGRVWFGAEYLLWTTKGDRLPALATVANGVGSPTPALPNRLGALGQPGTQTVIGDRDYHDAWRSGLRLYGGLWFTPDNRIGAEMDWFYLGDSKTNERVGNDSGNAFVYRPFTNNTVRNANGSFTAVAPFQDTELVSYPNVLAGQVAVNTESRLWGLNPNAVFNLCCDPCGRLDLLIGYRHLDLQDRVDIREDLRGLAGSANPGATFVVQDSFATRNRFNGVNLGMAWERRFGGAFFLNVRGSVGLGNTNTTVDINGSTTTNSAGVTNTSVGGLLAQPSNIGRYELNKFAVVPEVTARLGVQLTDNIRIYGGYNFLYWSNVVRPGDVIDLRVNGSQLPPRTNQTGELFPRFEPKYSDFWAHGVQFGLQFRF